MRRDRRPPGLEARLRAHAVEHVFVTSEGAYALPARARAPRALGGRGRCEEISSRSRTRCGSSISTPTDARPSTRRAALRWLERYLAESLPRLQNVAEVTASLARRELEAGERSSGGRVRIDPPARRSQIETTRSPHLRIRRAYCRGEGSTDWTPPEKEPGRALRGRGELSPATRSGLFS